MQLERVQLVGWMDATVAEADIMHVECGGVLVKRESE